MVGLLALQLPVQLMLSLLGTFNSGAVIAPDTLTVTPAWIRGHVHDLFNACVGYTAIYVGPDLLTNTGQNASNASGIRVTGPPFDAILGSESQVGTTTTSILERIGFGWENRISYRTGSIDVPPDPFSFWVTGNYVNNWLLIDNATGQTPARDAESVRTFRSGASRSYAFYGQGGLSGVEAQRQVTIDTGITNNITPAVATITPNTGSAAGYIGFEETDGFGGEPASTYTITGPGASTTVLTGTSGESLTSINTRISAVVNNATQSPLDYTSVIAGNNLTLTSDITGAATAWNVAVNNFGGNGTITYSTARTQLGTNNTPTSYEFDPQTTATPALYVTTTGDVNIGLNQGATAFLTSIGTQAAALETPITWDGVVRTVGSTREITIDLGTTTQVDAVATIMAGNGLNTTLTSTRIDGDVGMLVGSDTIYTATDHNSNVVATVSRTVPLATDNDLADVLSDLAAGINTNIEVPIDFMATSNGTQLILTAQTSGVVSAWSVSVNQQGQVANVGNIIFPAPVISTSGTEDTPGVGTTITVTDPEDSSTTDVVIAGRDAGYSAAEIATLIAAATIPNWDLSVVSGSPTVVRFESDTGRVVSGLWTGTSTTNTVALAAVETTAGVDPVAVGVTSITVTTPDANSMTVAIDGGVTGRSAIEISNALVAGLSEFTDWTASTEATDATVVMTADNAQAYTGAVTATSTNPDITFDNFEEPTPGVTYEAALQATVTIKTPGDTFTQAYTITGPKTNAQILTELNQNLTVPGWSDVVDGSTLRFTNNAEIAVEGLFTITSSLGDVTFSTFVVETEGAAQADAQVATFTFTQNGNTYTETLTGPVASATEIAEVLATLSNLTGYTASFSGANLIYTADVVGLRTLIDAQVTGTDVTVTASIDTPGNTTPVVTPGSYLYPTGRFTDPNDLYMVAQPDDTSMFRAERQVAWDVTEPVVSNDPDDYDFVRWVGEDGEDGDRTATLNLYYVNSDENTTPDGPIGQFVYNFVDGTLLGGNLNGWTPQIPTLEAGNFLWQIQTSIISSNENIIVEATDFSNPALIGSNGIAGGSGTNTAPVYAYKRDVLASDTGPSITRTWVFSSAGFSNTDLGNGWTSFIPSGTTSLSFAAAVASSVSDTDDVLAADWSTPQLLGSSGIDGINTAVIYAYKRASGTSLDATDIPSTGRTWTFATGTFDNIDLGNDWSSEIPFGTGNLFTSIAIASGTGATDFVPASEWSAAQLLSQTGSDGAAGINSAIVFLYQTSTDVDTAPSAVTSSSIYTFATGTIAPTPLNGWTTTVPQVPVNNFLWVTQAVASNTDGATSDTIAASEWSTPVRVGTSGVDGTNGNSVAIVELYRVVPTGTDLSTLPVPTGQFTYTYETNLLEATVGIDPGVFNNWAQSLPAVSEGTSLLVIQAAAVSKEDTDTIDGTDFSSPVIVSTAGGDGADGPRGAGRWNYREGTEILGSYTQAELDARLLLAGAPAAAVEGDQLWIFGSPSPADLTVTAGQQVVYLYNGTTWLIQAEVIDGSLLVTDTVTARRVAAGDLTSTDVPTGTASGAFFDDQGEAVIGNAANFIRFAGGTLTVSGEIQNLSRAILAAETGGPFFRIRTTAVTTDVAAAILEEFPTGSLAGEYIFVLVGGGGGGSAATESDIFQPAGGFGGAAGGCCIFSFYWDGVTALSTFLPSAGGIVDPGNTNGSRIAGTNGGNSTFTYGTTLIAQANGGAGGAASFDANATNAGGTASFPAQTDIDFIQTYARTGQSTRRVNRGTGGAAVDFFGIIDGTPGDSGHSPYDQGSFFVVPEANGDFDGAVGFITDDNVRALMGIYGGSTSLISGYGSRQTGPIGGIAIDNSLSTGDDPTGGTGGILSGGGGTRNLATTRNDLSAGGTSSQAGNGGPGGGGGGAHCAFGRAVGASGGSGSLWWSRI